MDTIVVMASGGIGSSVAAWRARAAGQLHLVHFNWGQRAIAMRRRSVEALAKALGAARAAVLDLPHLSQIGRGSDAPPASAAPLGETPVGLMNSLLSAAVQYAVRSNARTIVYGGSQVANEADLQVLPNEGTRDRRREFFFYYNAMLDSALPQRNRVQIDTPLIDLSRSDVVRLGQRFGVPFKLTWSCVEGGAVACGSCPSCQSRTRAFLDAGVPDATLVGTARETRSPTATPAAAAIR